MESSNITSKAGSELNFLKVVGAERFIEAWNKKYNADGKSPLLAQSLIDFQKKLRSGDVLNSEMSGNLNQMWGVYSDLLRENQNKP